MFDLIVKNGNIVTGKSIYNANLCVKDEKIAAITTLDQSVESKVIVDATNHYVFPGGIDTHVHMNDPGYTWREDFEHGSSAAAVGGITTILDMPLQNTPALTDETIFNAKEKHLSAESYTDFCFWGGLANNNYDHLASLDRAGCIAFKSFIGPVSSDYESLSIGQAREALKIGEKIDARIGFHCEDYSIIKWEENKAITENKSDWRAFLDSRPLIAEVIATNNIIDIAKELKSKVHICHVSHPAVAELIRRAQADGLDITGETCCHYLLFNEDHLIQKGSLFKCAPPLRDQKAVDLLWDYVDDGTLGSVCSDHSPCELSEKDVGKHGIFKSWGGISGVQHSMQLLYSEGVVKRGLSPTLISRSLGEGPAYAFGLSGKKGSLEVGYDADIVVFDPTRKWVITPESLQYKNKISAFVGVKGTGFPVKTILRGKVVAEEGRIVCPKGMGRLIKKHEIYA